MTVLTDAQRQQRVEKYASSYHVVGDGGVTFLDAVEVSKGADVAVVDDMVADEGQHAVESIEVYLSAVLLSAGAGMDGDAGKREVVEYGDEGKYFLWTVQPKAHLDAQSRLEARDDIFQYATHFVGVGEDAAASVLGSDASHRTTDVPVHLGVAHFVEAVGEVCKLYRLLTQDLGYDGERVFIVLWQDVVNLLPSIGQIAVREGKKGRYGIVDSLREASVVCFAKYQFGEPLHGSQDEHGEGC